MDEMIALARDQAGLLRQLAVALGSLGDEAAAASRLSEADAIGAALLDLERGGGEAALQALAAAVAGDLLAAQSA